MKYPALADLLGWDQENTNLNRENGVFLQPVEVAKIEQKLADAQKLVIPALAPLQEAKKADEKYMTSFDKQFGR